MDDPLAMLLPLLPLLLLLEEQEGWSTHSQQIE